MAKYYYRLDNVFEWQGASGNAIVAFVNPLGSNKVITFRNIEIVPITSTRSLMPYVIARVDNIFGGIQVPLTPLDTQVTLPQGFEVVKNCGVGTNQLTIRRSTDWWKLVSPTATAPASLSPFNAAGMYLSKRLRNQAYFTISNIAEPITLRNNEFLAVVGQFAGYITPVMIDLEVAYNNKAFSTSFFAIMSGSNNLCPVGIRNVSGQIVSITRLDVKPVGTVDTPFLRIVPIAGIQAEALQASQQKIPSSWFVKYDTRAPDINDKILLAYMNVSVIPYGVPIEYASVGGTATPRGANYLHTKDFIGPDYMVFFPEVRTATPEAFRDDLGITISKKGSVVKKNIVLRPGDGMAIVSSAETLAAWGGTASWAINFGFDIEIADIEYTLTLVNIKPGSEVRIYDQDMNELAGTESVGPDGIFQYSYTYTPNTYITIVIHHLNYLHYRIDSYLLPPSNTVIPIAQQIDRQYYNP